MRCYRRTWSSAEICRIRGELASIEWIDNKNSPNLNNLLTEMRQVIYHDDRHVFPYEEGLPQYWEEA